MKAPAALQHIVGRLVARSPGPAPVLAANTFVRPGNQWYQPVIGGAQTLASYVAGGAIVREALHVLERLTPDAYADFVRDFYRAGLQKYGDRWQYADINTALLGLSATLQPGSYLEIGVRRGRSLAMVASRVPSCRILACDLFLENYAGMENPGPDFVRAELAKVDTPARSSSLSATRRPSCPPCCQAGRICSLISSPLTAITPNAGLAWICRTSCRA